VEIGSVDMAFASPSVSIMWDGALDEGTLN
jgi:hypothetical protein